MPKFVSTSKNLQNVDPNILLKSICERELNERFKDKFDIYKPRLDFELEVIKNLNFADYFLVVADFVDHSKKQGIFVGPGRGSAPGSLVCYLTKITDVDPIVNDLLFERFLNPERVNLPGK
jgi:DNA polymerase-3 subunit alpha